MFQELPGVSLDGPSSSRPSTTAQGPAHSCQEVGWVGTGQTAPCGRPLSPAGHLGQRSEMTLSRPSWAPVVYVSQAAQSVRPALNFGESGLRDCIILVSRGLARLICSGHFFELSGKDF